MNPIGKRIVESYVSNPEVQKICKGKLHGGHIGVIHNKSGEQLDNLLNHIDSMLKNRPIKNQVGGSGGVGGSIQVGGVLDSHKDMYHFVLKLRPHDFELVREIAAQLLGARPSPMWDKYTEGNEPLESNAESYDMIHKMPNNHSLAKMIEAESGHGQGGGIGKAFKHVARIAGKVYKAGHHVLKYLDRNKDLLLNLPGISDYKEEINGLLDTASRIDDAVNPIVDATVDAVRKDASKQDKDKLKRLAEENIKKVVEKNVPQGENYIKLYEDARRSIPINAM